MAATVVTDFSFTNDAESVTNWVAYKISGTGGDPSAALEADVFIQNANSISCTVNKQRVWLYYDNSGGTQLDFSTSGPNELDYVYIWFNFATPGFSQVRSSGGITIALGDSDANYYEYYIDGSDTYYGGWKRAVIHPNSATPSVTNGSPDLANIDRIGIIADVQGSTARFTNLFVDRIDVGTKLRVYDTASTKIAGDNTTGTWADILAADEGTQNNKYGIVRSINDIIYVNGAIELGDGDSTNAASLDDEDRIIVWENPTYYDGAEVVSCVDDNWAKLTITGNSTAATVVTHGNKVGTGDTAVGSNGCTFQSSGPLLTVDFSETTHADTLIKTYGCKFFKAEGGIALSDDTDHEFIGDIVDQCGQIDPSQTEIRNSVFSGTTDLDGDGSALLWNTDIDIKNSDFLANTHATNDPHAILHTISGVYDYDNLQFSGNDYDIALSGSAGTDYLTINSINTANPGTYEVIIGSGVSILNAVFLTVDVESILGTAISGATVAIYTASGGIVQLMNEYTTPAGQAQESYNYLGTMPINIRIRKSSTGDTRYYPISAVGEIGTTGFTLTAVMSEDIIAA